jgi:hypothetical protein
VTLWTQKSGKELKYHYEQEKGNIACVISVDGKEEVRMTSLHRGRASKDEVRLAAAEEAVRTFHLRDVNAKYTDMKRRRVTRKKKKNQ